MIKKVRRRVKLLITLGLSLCFAIAAQAQTTTVAGKVTSNGDGSPLPGVSVSLKGTSTGASTDADGNYTIEARSGATLVFSFIGYATQEVNVGTQTEVNVVLVEDITQLGEVVVTAFGLERDKKALTYSAQMVQTDELSEARSLNVANSLSGKVAGLSFSTTGNGVGSSSRITLRGNRSLTGNNQPLFVIDGVPMDNYMSPTSTPGTDIGGTTTFNGISSINPEDIASISVLKGPSAAALYGTRASNGVIIITTKKGSAGQKATVSVSSNLMFSKAYNMLNLQDQYGQGRAGVYDPASRNSWGPEMVGQEVAAWQLSFNPNYAGPATYALTPQPDNGMDFFKTGYNWAKTISTSMGNQNTQGYFSYTNTTSEGIVPGNELKRHNVNLRVTSDLSSKLKLDVKTNYIYQEIDNALNTGEGSIGEGAYAMPRSMPYAQYKDYQYIDPAGQIRYNWPTPNSIGGVLENPAWLAKRNLRTDEQNRFIGMASLKYNFTSALSLQVRSGLDQSSISTDISKYASQSVIANEVGSYSQARGTTRELNSDFLLAYNKKFGDLSVNVSAGGNSLVQTRSTLTVSGPLSKRNFFAISNISSYTPVSEPYDKRINSLYGFAQLGYKDYLFLDVTARNDWSSALPKNNRSYFYPSVGLSGVLTDIFSVESEILTYLKVRASHASVGNDTEPYRLSQQIFYYGTDGGVVQSSTMLNNPTLKPEISSSNEFGLDARFLNNRIGLDFTFYETKTKNQIFTINVPESGGSAIEVVNGGSIRNRGIEVVLNADIIQSDNFKWDVTLNYSSYRTKVLSIMKGRPSLSIRTGSERLVQTIIKEGGGYGDLYIRGFNRTADGQILVNGTSGLPEFTPGFDINAGNFNPDWLGGLQNRLSYKNFSLSFLIDARVGGTVISYTQSKLAGGGASDITVRGREENFVVKGLVATRASDGTITSTTPNTTSISAENYWTQVAGRDPRSAEDFVFSATNVRLRELVLGYSLPKKFLEKTPLTGVNFSIVGRNLFFIVNKAKYFDPEQGVGVGNLQGVESFNIPTTRDIGFNVKVNF
ncbi:SusC/RagA family TonB-linked outer membrane protein [Parachryseolinea silvisoli]|uniref:SusC/RagA family TonB-linked outer membrane protein n=1 Tax=Parachryseolinea silvisoli TaxID=2873601 RepID=UPI002265D8B8|nr:SusC/RagA family TonB-linked outer membrane protein [Parachryseolinea silvisoli]MCD9017530.1 SusC/RagA family TonB-linked outer membrane protein [Parachryseolinea silvisoli]